MNIQTKDLYKRHRCFIGNSSSKGVVAIVGVFSVDCPLEIETCYNEQQTLMDYDLLWKNVITIHRNMELLLITET